jgi:hypothetical protein
VGQGTLTRRIQAAEQVGYRGAPRRRERVDATMALREKIRNNASALLQPGETIQAGVPAQTVSQEFAQSAAAQ